VFKKEKKMFSQLAKDHVANCRICFMCRHLCPVGLVTGKESHTPRGKAILVEYSIGAENAKEIFKSAIPSLYECCLCNACAGWCETGFEPGIFIREARREAVVEELLPPNIAPVVERLLKTGNLYDSADSLETASLPEKADVLVAMGNTALAKTPEIAKALMSILEKAGIDFTVLKKEAPMGGAMYDMVGELSEVQDVAREFKNAADATGAKTIVVLDPMDARLLAADYPRWNCTLEAEIRTATSYVAELLDSGKIKVKNPRQDLKVTYHDPCKLARDMDETEPARKIIAAIGADFHEIFLNKKDTKCCGNECLASHTPRYAVMTARARLEQAEATGAETLLVSCPGCFDVFSAGRQEENLRIKDLFVLLDECL
jgi:Fe-S oxidoreductase